MPAESFVVLENGGHACRPHLKVLWDLVALQCDVLSMIKYNSFYCFPKNFFQAWWYPLKKLNRRDVWDIGTGGLSQVEQQSTIIIFAFKFLLTQTVFKLTRRQSISSTIRQDLQSVDCPIYEKIHTNRLNFYEG